MWGEDYGFKREQDGFMTYHLQIRGSANKTNGHIATCRRSRRALANGHWDQ